jgi:membrane protein
MVVSLAKATISEFARHKSQWLAAAIAYFTVFAIAPLIIVVVEIAGLILGQHEATLTQLYSYLSTTAGPSAADGVRSIVTATLSQRRAGTLSQIVGWTVFVVAAVGLFGSLQAALNTVWDVETGKRTLKQTALSRLVAFAAVLAAALLLLISLGVNAALTIADAELAHLLPAVPLAATVLDFVVSFVMVTVLFALLFKFLPECQIAWRDIGWGAAVSGLMFVIGQFLLGWYIGRAGISSSYGTFGGLVVFLVWVYYSAQIVLFGAEFTHVYARRFGSLRAEAPAA